MCIFAGFGLLLIAGGWHVASKGELIIGGFTVVCGLWCLSVLTEEWRSDGIDVSVRNKIVAHDGNGRYLVEAKTFRQIQGPRPHVTGNLPAGLYKVRDGLWIVDRSGGPEPDSRKIQWQPVNGDYHIEPRGNQAGISFLRDVMEGYEHDYIVRDE